MNKVQLVSEQVRELINHLRAIDLSLAVQFYKGSPLEPIPSENDLSSDEAKEFWLYALVSFAVGQNHSGLYLGGDYSLSDLFPQASFFSQCNCNLRHFFEEKLEDLPKGLVWNVESEILFFQKWDDAEAELAEHFARYFQEIPYPKSSHAKSLFREFFPTNSLDKNPWQAVACLSAIGNRLSIISGGPGTGKTTTIAKLVAIMLDGDCDKVPSRIHLLAPTGKAADRMNEAFGKTMGQLLKQSSLINKEAFVERMEAVLVEGQTIHRFLGRKKDGSTASHSYRKVKTDWVIIDEGSMIDMSLFLDLFRALPEHCRITILGDCHQLSAVETGNVFADFIQFADHGSAGAKTSDRFDQEFLEWSGFELVKNQLSEKEVGLDYLTELSFSYRFENDSSVSKMANLLLEEKRLPYDYEQIVDLVFYTEGWEKKLASVFSQYRAMLVDHSAQDCLQYLSSRRILSAVRQGEYGVDWINHCICQYILGDVRGEVSPQKGLPFMITENSPSLNLWNGDFGIFFPDDEGILQAYLINQDSDHELRQFSPYALPRWELSFATTVHKSQGSEYDYVYLLLPPQLPHYISLELVYTGVTRAKKEVKLFISEGDQGTSLAKVNRYSGLQNRLLASLQVGR